jgi:GxxExxY protein
MDRIPDMEHEELTEKIIGCAMVVHSTLGPGFLESMYEKALAHELTKAGLRVECQKPITVTYDDITVGEFSADMFVEETIMVENKAIHALYPINEVQLVNYLTATRVDVGLVFNFGSDRLQFRRKHRMYRPTTASILTGDRSGPP